MKLNANQVEFKETTRKLEHKIEELQAQLKEKVDAQSRITTNLRIKLDREILMLKEKSPPYIWKIEEFREILRDAKRGRDTEIESGYFFSGPNGYKLMVFMYPNGSGDGENTHLSVYFRLMRGKYDAVLPWPFRKAVTFTLIDQQADTTLRENHVETINCNNCSESFARPKRDSNWGYGSPTFIPHQELFKRRYIVDDTLFLQVQVGPLS